MAKEGAPGNLGLAFPAKGTAPAFGNDGNAPARLDDVATNQVVANILAPVKNGPPVAVLGSFAELPAQVQADARKQGADQGNSKGALKGEHSWILHSNHATAADLEASVGHRQRSLFQDGGQPSVYFVSSVTRY